MRLKLFIITIVMLFPLFSFAEEEESISIRVKERIAVRTNPHISEEEGCAYCHEKGKVQEGILRKPLIDSLCADCHDLGDDHVTDPYPYNLSGLIKEMKKRGILLGDKGINCITCHEKHNESGREYYLNMSSFEFYQEVKSINPHWVKGYCYACHNVDPDRSPNIFKRKGDMERVCNNCHGSISSDKLIHAVGMVPSKKIKARMPDNFALTKEGKIDCLTCHELKYQCLEKEYHRKSKDPHFFRDGPYSNRSDICWKCHLKDSYGRLNPHDQITDEGVLLKERCLYCHEETPDPQRNKGIGSVKLVTEDLKELCQRCHRDVPHPGGSFVNFDHLVTPPKKVKLSMKMAEIRRGVIMPLEPGSDKIFCATCHNPHERGVLRGQYGMGADEDRRLRLGAGFELCGICHVDKTGML